MDKPTLTIYDDITGTKSTRSYETHTDCFKDFTALRAAGVEVKIK